jgi:pilus assembly protein CpaF
MRPDRIVVWEIRGGEAFEMMQAVNTGHDGSLSTVHANSSVDAVARVENMVLPAGFQIPVRVVREQSASGIHMIVRLERSSDGVRRVKTITELTGAEGDQLTSQGSFQFVGEGRREDGSVVGRNRPTGLRPIFSDAMLANGRELQADLFVEGVL